MSGKLPGIAPDVRPGDASAPPVPATRGRIWPAVALVILFWGIYALPRLIEWPIYAQFFTSVIDTASLTLLFLLWWSLTRSATRGEHLWGLAALFGGGAVAVALSQKTLGTIGVLIFGLPIVFTAWAALATCQPQSFGSGTPHRIGRRTMPELGFYNPVAHGRSQRRPESRRQLAVGPQG